jgi:hypothetical protein
VAWYDDIYNTTQGFNRSVYGRDIKGPSDIRASILGDGTDPGYLGQGYRQPGQVSVDPNAAKIPGYDQDRSSALAQAMGASNRAGPQMQGASINMRPQDQFRGQQMNLAQALTAQANGQGPSLAQMQLQQATDKNLAQSMALGQSLGGAQAAGLAQRQVMQQQAGTAQQAAADSGALRLQEQMQARNQLAQVLAGARVRTSGSRRNRPACSRGHPRTTCRRFWLSRA